MQLWFALVSFGFERLVPVFFLLAFLWACFFLVEVVSGVLVLVGLGSVCVRVVVVGELLVVGKLLVMWMAVGCAMGCLLV